MSGWEAVALEGDGDASPNEVVIGVFESPLEAAAAALRRAMADSAAGIGDSEYVVRATGERFGVIV